jgi:diguanylate cyclase (GGDEF)-like protein
MKKPKRAIAATGPKKGPKTSGSRSKPVSKGASRSASKGASKSVSKGASKSGSSLDGRQPRAAAAAGRSTEAATIRSLRAELSRALRRIAELESAADTDFLLDIPNRRGFERELQRAVGYIKRYRASGALIVLDVDRLKPINDAFGHAAGDEVLKAIVAALKRQVRSSDVVGRLGGDEFALLLWNLSATDAKAKAAALEQAIDELSFVFGGKRVDAGASAGVALLGSTTDAGRALEEADAAMYVRKAQRRHEAPIQAAG